MRTVEVLVSRADRSTRRVTFIFRVDQDIYDIQAASLAVTGNVAEVLTKYLCDGLMCKLATE